MAKRTSIRDGTALAARAGAEAEGAAQRLVSLVSMADGDGSQRRLRVAVAARALADAADRLARVEVLAARELDGATWEQVGAAFGVSRQSAHERFRTGPDGMHSRLFKRQDAQLTSSAADSATTAGRAPKAPRRASSARS